ILEVQRRGLIFSEGVWTTFPYQFHLHGLSQKTVSECVMGFVEAVTGPERPLHNAADFILRYLGEGIARHFMFPYNQKLYTVPCEELSAQWGGRFIQRPTLQQVIDGAIGAGEQAGYNASFWYPRQGGIESLVRGLAADVRGDVRLGARVAGLDLERR